MSTGCTEQFTEPLQIDTAYFPLQTGRYIIYDVDSIGYWGFADSVIVRSYQIREEIDSPYVDASGQKAYRLVRSYRKSQNDPWVITDVWSAMRTATTAEKVEENLRFIKQVFPISEGRRWYGNAYINTDSPHTWLAGWVYKYEQVHTPSTIGNFYFDSTITVVQRDMENAIEKMYFEEKYARRVGLIYKVEEHLLTQPGKPIDGYSIVYRLNDYE